MTALRVLKPVRREVVIPDSHRDLKSWQRAMELVRLIHTVTEDMPGSAECAVIRGLREISLEIPTHIARGAARGSTADFIRSLASARGALAAMETHAILAQQLGYIDLEERRKIQVITVEVKTLLEQLGARLI